VIDVEYKRVGDFLVIRLDEDERIVERVEEVCSREGITSGIIHSVAGALKECALIFRRGCQQEFKEHLEVVGNGNVSEVDGKPKVHLHIAGGNDSRTVSGHLIDGAVAVFCEVILQALRGFEMRRAIDESLLSQRMLNPYVLRP
jgi:predicted DNA-binding protein with PD1-like motif